MSNIMSKFIAYVQVKNKLTKEEREGLMTSLAYYYLDPTPDPLLESVFSGDLELAKKQLDFIHKEGTKIKKKYQSR